MRHGMATPQAVAAQSTEEAVARVVRDVESMMAASRLDIGSASRVVRSVAALAARVRARREDVPIIVEAALRDIVSRGWLGDTTGRSVLALVDGGVVLVVVGELMRDQAGASAFSCCGCWPFPRHRASA